MGHHLQPDKTEGRWRLSQNHCADLTDGDHHIWIRNPDRLLTLSQETQQASVYGQKGPKELEKGMC